MKSAACSVVPDAMAILRVAARASADAPDKLVAVAVEQDSGCERLKLWTEKTHGYAAAILH